MDEPEAPALTSDEMEALKIAGELIDAGVPIFAAAPNPNRPGSYYLPKEWEKTVPSRTWLDRWRPGWALAAVGGHAADFLDIDPRNGGRESEKELRLQGQFPRSFGEQSTPSGGTHHLISSTGERKRTNFMPGLDLQSGGSEPDQKGTHGRGFVYIAPTVRPSKAPETLGELHPYRWVRPPELELLDDFRGSDDSLDGLVARVVAHRYREPEPAVRVDVTLSPFLQASQAVAGGQREFSLAEAEAYCTPTLVKLRNAQVGGIEDACNDAAVMLSHFVPAFWSVDQAYAVLSDMLSHTAYDAGGVSDWTVEKFRAVLDGTRPPASDWKAVRKPETVAPGQPLPAATADEVDALLAEMLTADQLIDQPPPRFLVKGLLNLDSTAWVIGAPGSKKSFVMLDLAAHVARGMPWRERKIQQGPVVMIVAEGAAGMSTRVKAWQKTYGRIGEADAFRVLPRPVQVTDSARWSVLVEACRRLGPVLVVIDTQARVTVGLEENSAKDMGIFIDAAERIRQATGACVAVVHHTGRSGGDARGSSAIDGAQYTELKVVRQDALTGVLRVEKQKDLAEVPEIPLYFDRVVVGTDEDGDEIASLVLAPSNAYRAHAGQGETPEQWQVESIPLGQMILRVYSDHGGETRGLTKAEARSVVVERFYGGVTTRLHKSTWNTGFNRLVDSGKIVTIGGGRFVTDHIAAAIETEDAD